MNEYVVAVIELLAGLGALLIGFKLLSDNIEKLANSGVKKLFNKTSKNRWVGVGIGAAVTAIIQSSGASTVMIVGFVNAGIMDLFQATAMIMGANIGTTITAQIAALDAFDVGTFAMLLAFIGTFMSMIAKKDKTKTIGLALGGLGLVFLALGYMGDAMDIFKKSQAFTDLLQNVNNPLLLLLIGIGFTALIQSSSATTTILITMVGAGLAIGNSPNAILYVVLGSNIGSCVTALLSSISASNVAKRASLIHLMFNTFGTIIYFIVLLLWQDFYTVTFGKWFPGAPQTQLAMFHTFINVSMTLLFVPFINYFVKLATWILPDKKQISNKSFIDERFLGTPSIALSQVHKETLRLGTLAMEALNDSIDCFVNKNYEGRSGVYEKIKIVDGINENLLGYLVKVANQDLPIDGEKLVSNLHFSINDFYREAEIADNMIKYTRHLVEDNIKFSSKVFEQIGIMRDKLNQQFAYLKDMFENNNYAILAEVDQVEDEIDKLRSTMINDHIARLEKGECSPASSGVYINLVSNLERAGDHLAYIAHKFID